MSQHTIKQLYIEPTKDPESFEELAPFAKLKTKFFAIFLFHFCFERRRSTFNLFFLQLDHEHEIWDHAGGPAACMPAS